MAEVEAMASGAAIVIRDARQGEAAPLTRLARRAKASWGYPEPWMRAWADELAFSDERIREGGVLVAELDGAPAGVVAVATRGGGPEIEHLWVEPRLHGMGVGRALLEKAVAVAADDGWRELWIESDPGAVGFYQRFGAEPVGSVPAPVCGVARRLPLLRLRIPAPSGR